MTLLSKRAFLVAAAALLTVGPGAQAQPPQTQPAQTPAAIYRNNIARIFTVHAPNSLGTAFVISPRRLVTNAHVVGDSPTAEVESQAGVSYPVKVVTKDTDRDFAILEFSGAIPPFSGLVPLQRAHTPDIGEGVVVIGSPIGSKGTVTTGIVSQVYANGAIQLNAAVNPGNSGGPVFDMQGRVFGIATSRFKPLADGQSVIGLAVAIPIGWLDGQ